MYYKNWNLKKWVLALCIMMLPSLGFAADINTGYQSDVSYIDLVLDEIKSFKYDESDAVYAAHIATINERQSEKQYKYIATVKASTLSGYLTTIRTADGLLITPEYLSDPSKRLGHNEVTPNATGFIRSLSG